MCFYSIHYKIKKYYLPFNAQIAFKIRHIKAGKVELTSVSDAFSNAEMANIGGDLSD